jgi:predicted hydrocarbon binding protein
VHWLRKLFERHVRGPVRVELVNSAALGDQNCVFRVEIDDPSPPPR